MGRSVSDQYSKVVWLLDHQELWKDLETCGREMIKVRLLGKQTNVQSVKLSIRNWIELARQVQVGEVDLESLRGNTGYLSFF